jgi:hypothetical protein
MLIPEIAVFLNVYEGASTTNTLRNSIPMNEIQGQSFQPFVSAPLKVGFQGSCVRSQDGLIPMLELNKRRGLSGRLLILAGQRISWSPTLIAGELWRLITNIDMLREILGLLRLRPFNEIVQDNPGLAFKYVIPNYLARGFTVTERASCFLHHHRRMYAALPERVLRQVLQGDVTFYEISDGSNCFAMTIGLPRPPFDKEGELSLSLKVDGKTIFNLSFIIIPGWVVKSKVAEILLITRLQGTQGCLPQFKLVRKGLQEYSPRKLLLAALQGIADAFGIGELEAVCAANQRSYGRTRTAIFESGYDDFFAKAGMVKTAAGFYSSPVPIEGRPLALFKGRNRTRARKRRAIRQQIQSACTAFLLGAADRAVHSTSGEVNPTPAQRALESRLSPISCPTPDSNLTL